MPTFLTWLFIGVLSLCLLLNIVNLPGNWIIIGLLALWDWLSPLSDHPGWLFWILVIGLGVTGEILENYLQILKGRHAGASKKSMWAAFLASIFFSIILAPLLFGPGAIIGAFLGAWLGCVFMELLSGKPFPLASKAALGTLSGRMLGTLCKLGLGGSIICISVHAFLPSS